MLHYIHNPVRHSDWFPIQSEHLPWRNHRLCPARGTKKSNKKNEKRECFVGADPIILLNRSTFIHHHLCLLYNRDARDSFPEFNRMDAKSCQSSSLLTMFLHPLKRGDCAYVFCGVGILVERAAHSRLLLCIYIENPRVATRSLYAKWRGVGWSASLFRGSRYVFVWLENSIRLERGQSVLMAYLSTMCRALNN